MAGLHGIPIMEVPYDVDAFDFRTIIKDALGVNNLTMLHKSGEVALLTREKDQSTRWHKKFYKHHTERFDSLYRDFIRDVVTPLFGEPVVFQKVPTFRVHLNGNVAVGEFHRDRDYNHMTSAVTCWVPVTDAFNNNAVWVEQGLWLHPMPVPYGMFMLFDSVNLLHGNQKNDTGLTRVSFDFRVIPKSQFKPSKKASINTGMKFDIGGYYDVL